MMLELDRAYNVECLKGMESIDDQSIDLIFSDLPYGTTKNQWDVVIDPESLWKQYERVIKPNGAVILFGQGMFTAKMMLSNPQMHRYNIVWNKVMKSGFLNANRMPLRSHEDIMVFYKKQPTYNPQMIRGKPSHSRKSALGGNADDIVSNRVYGSYKVVESVSDMKYPGSIWTFPKPHSSVAISSTEKPVELCRYVIRTYTNEGDVVLDNCCGSGSICVAAALEKRHFIGMDNGVCDKKNSKYYGFLWAKVTEQRVNESLGGAKKQ